MFNSSKHVSSLRKLLTSYSSCNNRQTVFASASIPQHRRFVYDCIQQKWTKVGLVIFLVFRVSSMGFDTLLPLTCLFCIMISVLFTE